MSDQFDQITQNFNGTTSEYKQQADDYARKRSNRRMNDTPSRKTANGATASGVLLILLAVLTVIPWGFGADRFLWIATASGGVGIALVVVGAVIGKNNKP